MIKFENVTKTYPGGTIGVKNVNLDIKPGEFVSIVGQSGTGKTTMAKLIISELKPDRGKIIIGGWDITDIPANEVPYLRRQIGVVFQDFKLLPKKTVFENVSFALEVAGAEEDVINKIVPQVLAIVNLKDKGKRFPSELSGGEQQRVVIARALVHQPKILLADEPTGNLDSIHAQEIIEILKKVNSFGTTVVLVTHNREIVNMLRKRVVALENGMIFSDHVTGKYVI